MRRQKIRNTTGFTLVEIVAVIGVIAILAAVMVPTIIKHLDDSKEVRAKKEVEVIATAFTGFYKDTGRWPTKETSKKLYTVDILQSTDGETSTRGKKATGWDKLKVDDVFLNHFVENTPMGKSKEEYTTTGENKWNGPYAMQFKPDPWGRKYECNTAGLQPGASGPVWVISAGQDGVLDTNTDDTSLQGDDIGFLIKR